MNGLTKSQLAEMAKLDEEAKARREAAGTDSVGEAMKADPVISRLDELMKDAPDERPDPEHETPKPRVLNETFAEEYREPGFEPYPETRGIYLDRLAKLCRIVNAGGIGILVGPYGTGKTRLLAETARATRHRGARYIRTGGLFREIRSTYNRFSNKTEKDVFEEFLRLPLICLDEIDKRSETANENALIFNLIDERFDAKKPTLIAGNVSLKELSTRFDAAILDRVKVGGGLIAFEGESFRRRN